MAYVWAFVVAGAIFAAIDAVWLKLMAGFYKKEFGGMLRAVPNFATAVAFYVLYVLGIVVFVLAPSFDSGQWWNVATYGVLFGMVAYAWGAAVTGSAATLTFVTLKGWVF